MKKPKILKRDPLRDAYRRFIEADDPSLREEYRLTYERMLSPSVPQPSRDIDKVKIDRAGRQRSIYKP